MIEERKAKCLCCHKETDFVYIGPFFSADEVEDICPWCIKDGTAATKFNGEFQDAASCDDVDKKEYLEELIYRTAGYSGWQKNIG